MAVQPRTGVTSPTRSPTRVSNTTLSPTPDCKRISNRDQEDFGTHSADPVDYPDFVRAAARAVAEGQHPLGVVVGGSGNEAIVANRLRGIRCAVVWNKRTARLAKEHGNCNMIAVGQRLMSKEEAISIVDAWLAAEFKGGRHQRRIDRIDE